MDVKEENENEVLASEIPEKIETFTDRVKWVFEYFIGLDNPCKSIIINGGKFGELRVYRKGNKFILTFNRKLTTIQDKPLERNAITGELRGSEFIFKGITLNNDFVEYEKTPRHKLWCEQRFEYLMNIYHHLGFSVAFKENESIYMAMTNLSGITGRRKFYTFRGKEITKKEYDNLPKVIKDYVQVSIGAETKEIKKGEFFSKKLYDLLPDEMKANAIVFELTITE